MHRYSSCNHFYSMKCKSDVRSHLPLRGLAGRRLCHVIRYCYRVESSLGRWVRRYYLRILPYVLATTLGNLNAPVPAAIAHGCDHQSASITVDKVAGLPSQMHLQRSMLQTTCSLSFASIQILVANFGFWRWSGCWCALIQILPPFHRVIATPSVFGSDSISSCNFI
jgi:hypothetical protein